MSSKNDFEVLRKQINFRECYSEKDWQKDVKEFRKLSAFLSDEHSKDLAEFMVIMINSDSNEKNKKEMFKGKYKVLAQLTMAELGEKGYASFVREKIKKFKAKK